MPPPRKPSSFPAFFALIAISVTAYLVAKAHHHSTPTSSTVQPGTFSGLAFDACAAPSTTEMTAWKAHSPYRAIGIYIGGSHRGCAQPSLTADWVRTQTAAGWHLIPLYVGPQASCTRIGKKKNLIDDDAAAPMGTAAAVDAVEQAGALGLKEQSTIVYDMEAYRTGNPRCRDGVIAFVGAWTAKLHELGYLSGFYSSIDSGGADQVANYAAPGYVRPDYVDFAHWDKQVTLVDAAIPSDYWAPHRRMKQYAGDHDETYGGVTINIDSNFVDFAP